jgi:hypothetical protein
LGRSYSTVVRLNDRQGLFEWSDNLLGRTFNRYSD